MRQGLSITDMARKAGVERTTLSRLLSGARPRLGLKATEKLAKAFPEVSVEQLLGLKPSPRRPSKPGKAARR